MDEHASEVESLSREVRELKRRMLAVERAVGLSPPEPVSGLSLSNGPIGSSGSTEEPRVEAEPPGIAPIAGRALLGIAGAYILRAAAESGAVPQLAAKAAAVVYALWWLISSARLAAKSHLLAGAHVVTAVLVIYPMVWETTVRFHAMPPSAAAAVLAAFAAAGLAVAWPRNLGEVVWITILAGLGTSAALLVATSHLFPFTAAILVMATAVEACACRDHWLSLRAITAMVADLAVLLTTFIVTRPGGLPEGYAPVTLPMVLSVQVGLLLVYLASTVVRTLLRGLHISAFEVVQTAAAFAISMGGALRVVRESIAGGAAVAWFCLFGGIACYLVAFAFLDRHARRDANFYTYSTYGLLLVLAGTRLMMSDWVLAVTWSLLAMAATWIGNRADRSSVRAHGACYLWLTAMISGMAAQGWSSVASVRSTPLSGEATLAAIGCLLTYGVFWAASRGGPERIADRIPAMALSAGGCWATASLVSAWLIRDGDGWATTLRTILLTSLAALAAWGGSRFCRAELTALLYPLMALVGLKLLFQDFHQGTPATMAVSLLCFGGTLVALPRLARRTTCGAIPRSA